MSLLCTRVTRNALVFSQSEAKYSSMYITNYLTSHANCNWIVKSSVEEFYKTIDLEGREKLRVLRPINMINETLCDRPSEGLGRP